MVHKLKCDCISYEGCTIQSWQEYNSAKSFFEKWTKEGTFTSENPSVPYYTWVGNKGERIDWYATKWYKCKCCGCLWEFEEPEFPAVGFIRKFPAGDYFPQI